MSIVRQSAWLLISGVFLIVSAEAQDAEDALAKMRDFNAVQTIYRKGVPHTDKNGNLLHQYDPARSFLQIAVWGNPYGKIYDHEYSLKTLTDAGFNTMWPWPSGTNEGHLEAARQAGLQVVLMGQMDEVDAAKLKDHPNWLGNVWHDEPTGSFWGKDMDAKYQEFLDYKNRINTAAPGRAVFINDVPWITAPATQWWVKWNTSGDVACHDNYPVMNRGHLTRTIGSEENKSGIPDTVNLAVAVNKEEKPVWLIVGAFLQRGQGAFPFRMPTPTQLRAQVYAGIISGATGIIYFTWDTYVCRDGNVIGMSPDPKAAYIEPGPNRPKLTPAKPMEIAESQALWKAATSINEEIRTLTPSILSPTVGDDVSYTIRTTGKPVSDNPIRCLLKPHPEGGYLLLSVNLDDAVLTTAFEFPGGFASVAPLFENREPYTLEPGQTKFEDCFEPFETHVYRITVAPR